MNFRLVALVISSIILLVIPARKLSVPVGTTTVFPSVKLMSLHSPVSLPQQSKVALLPVPVAPVVAATSEPSDTAKAYIYDHESGNNPGAINSGSGACGLGQAYPCSKMPCSLSDYACQDAYFTSYMLSRYGSWGAAMTFWEANHNW